MWYRVYFTDGHIIECPNKKVLGKSASWHIATEKTDGNKIEVLATEKDGGTLTSRLSR